MILGAIIVMILFAFIKPIPLQSCTSCAIAQSHGAGKSLPLYVLNVANGTVSVINTTTGSLIKNITVGDALSDPDSIAATPGLTKIYIANQYSDTYLGVNGNQSALPAGTVSVINTSTDTVSRITSGFEQPAAIVVSANGKNAYVLNLNGMSDPLSSISNGTVTVINATTDKVTKVITIGLEPAYYNGTWPGLAITPDGSQVYAADCLSGKVSVINTTNDNISATVGVGALCPTTIRITPNGKEAYVLLANSGIISVIDTKTNILLGNIILPGLASSLAISNNSTDALATSLDTGSLYVINTTSNKLANVIGGINGPCQALVSPDGKRIYVANIGHINLNGTSGTVSVINATDYALIKTITVGPWPTTIAITPNSKTLYVTDFTPGLSSGQIGTVSVINATTLNLTDTIRVGSSPNALATLGSVQYGCTVNA